MEHSNNNNQATNNCNNYKTRWYGDIDDNRSYKTLISGKSNHSHLSDKYSNVTYKRTDYTVKSNLDRFF